ncbi:MAG: hypothetical protein Q9210_001129 [Variospora velana]
MNQTTSLRFRIAWYAIMVWTLLWGISTFFAAAFQCSPPSYYWSKYTRKTQGSCLNLTMLLIVTASTNIVTDVALLVLPMPVLWNLKIERSQKFALSGIFLLGGFVCVASITRAPYLTGVVTVDPQWTAVDASIWSIIEPGVGIICASLPSMGPILRKAFPVESLQPRKISLLSSTKIADESDIHRQPSGLYSSGCSSDSIGAGQKSNVKASM